jgi:hypothetical protein
VSARHALAHRPETPIAWSAEPPIGLSAGLITFVAIHLIVGPLFYEIRQLAVIHAFIVVGVGVWWAISPRKPIENIAYVGAYITGAEVVWRVTRVSGPVLFYEFAKYLLAALFILALVVRGQFQIKKQWPAVLYFVLLLPSALIPLTELDFEVARGDISFNLSGPLALMISVVFFGQVDLSRLDRRKFALGLIGPALCISSILIFLMVTRGAVFDTTVSNKSQSGNFGPNQVSAVLALAGVAAFLSVLEDKVSKGCKLLMFAIMTVVLIQSALTFSRGGLYMFSAAGLAAFLCLVSDSRKRIRVVAFGLVIFAATEYVIIPALDEFTNGAILTRFQDTRTTGRDELVITELELWAENPVFGVGPGQAMYHRDVSVVFAAAHTEFTRLLAEHGSFGFGSLLMLVLMALRTLRNPMRPAEKALVLSMWTFAMLFLATDGMRILAPSSLIGLSAVTHLKRSLENRRRPVSEAYFRQRRPAAGLREASQTV